MPSISVKKMLKKLQKAEGIKYKSADFIPKRGDKVEQAIVYYSVEDINWTPELVYIDDTMFNWLDVSSWRHPVKEKIGGIADKVLHYDSFYVYDNGKCLDIPCKIIAHGYYNARTNTTPIRPVFVVMNEELLKASDIIKQFKVI